MTQYLFKRVLAAIPTLFIVTGIIFWLLRLIPGDVALTRLASGGFVTEELLAKQRHELGIDRNPFVQYIDWLGGVVRGDFGNSLFSGDSVNGLIMERLPLTLEIVILAVALAVVIAIPLGVISAVKANTPIDYAARLFSVFGLSVPDFVFGTVTILVLSALLDDLSFGLLDNWLPRFGWFKPWEDPKANILALMFPAAILGYRLSAISARMTRSAMLEVLREDYVRTARAKGLGERTVVVRHALRNALIPVVTIMAGQVAFLFGGTVIIEQVFALPGMGRLTLDAVTQRDYTVVQGTTLMMAFVFVSVNLFVDMTYAWIDPRIRYS